MAFFLKNCGVGAVGENTGSGMKGGAAISHVTIFNAQGQVVFNASNIKSGTTYQVSVGSFPSGIYQCVITPEYGVPHAIAFTKFD